MPIINITYSPTPKSIGGFTIDAFLSESYQFTNDVTDVPVEEGSTTTDHVVEKPITLTISAFIGQTKFAAFDGDNDVSQFEGLDKKARIRHAYLELRRMKSERVPVDVNMGLDTFQNMIITSFTIDRDVESGADLVFDMSFQEIKIVKSKTSTVNISLKAKDRAAGTENKGSGQKKEDESWSDEMRKRATEEQIKMGIKKRV